MIPRVVHQIWIPFANAEMPARFQESPRAWKKLHPDWTHILWDAEALNAFVREHYPHVWDLFRSYPDGIQRVDAARYMLLHHFGGIYCDLDIIPQRPFDELMDDQIVVRGNTAGTVTNDLMLATPGHPFFERVIGELHGAYKLWQRWFIPRTFRVFLTAGPYFMSLVYLRSLLKDQIKVLSIELSGYDSLPHAYVRHVPGNTWAKWDTHLFMFFYDHFMTAYNAFRRCTSMRMRRLDRGDIGSRV